MLYPATVITQMYKQEMNKYQPQQTWIVTSVLFKSWDCLLFSLPHLCSFSSYLKLDNGNRYNKITLSRNENEYVILMFFATDTGYILEIKSFLMRKSTEQNIAINNSSNPWFSTHKTFTCNPGNVGSCVYKYYCYCSNCYQRVWLSFSIHLSFFLFYYNQYLRRCMYKYYGKYLECKLHLYKLISSLSANYLLPIVSLAWHVPIQSSYHGFQGGSRSKTMPEAPKRPTSRHINRRMNLADENFVFRREIFVCLEVLLEWLFFEDIWTASLPLSIHSTQSHKNCWTRWSCWNPLACLHQKTSHSMRKKILFSLLHWLITTVTCMVTQNQI